MDEAVEEGGPLGPQVFPGPRGADDEARRRAPEGAVRARDALLGRVEEEARPAEVVVEASAGDGRLF